MFRLTCRRFERDLYDCCAFLRETNVITCLTSKRHRRALEVEEPLDATSGTNRASVALLNPLRSVAPTSWGPSGLATTGRATPSRGNGFAKDAKHESLAQRDVAFARHVALPRRTEAP